MMSRLRLYKTEALVLRQVKLGEADRILTLYTPYLGKLRAVAKGVRRTKSRLAGHLEMLTRTSLSLARGRNLDVITQAQAQESFLPLKEDLVRLGQALYVVELVERFTMEAAENYSVYRLLIETLSWLAEAATDQGEVPLRYFELHLLRHSGYEPWLDGCLGCGQAVGGSNAYFSPSGGGVLCRHCLHGEPVVRPLSSQALEALRLLLRSEPLALRRLRLSPGLSLELEGLLRWHVQYLLEENVRSLAFLDTLRRLSAEELPVAARPYRGEA